MHIIIEYKIEDYIADLRKTAEIKIGILYKNTLLLDTIVSFIILVFLAIGAKAENVDHYLVGTILVIIAVVLLLVYAGQFIMTNSKKKNLQNLAKKHRFNGKSFKTFTFTETIFAIKTQENYSENSWNDYENYLVIDDYLFIIDKDLGLHQALFINRKQLSREEYEKLISFIRSKLIVWKS